MGLRAVRGGNVFICRFFYLHVCGFFSATLLKVRPRNAAVLFIWGCSMPLTICCYFFWIWGRDLTFGMTTSVVVLIAFAQIGWLGGLLEIFSKLVRMDLLRRIGLFFSVISIIGHDLLLALAFLAEDRFR